MLMAYGKWMNGSSAESHDVRLAIQQAHLVIRSMDGNTVHATWPLGELKVDAIYEGGEAQIECAAQPRALLVTTDAVFIGALARGGTRVWRLPRGRALMMQAIGSLLAVAVLLGVAYLGAPWLSGVLARAVPIQSERTLAPQMAAIFSKSSCQAEQVAPILQQLQARIDPRGEVAADIRLVNLDMPNAFTFPGGIVVITRGLLDEADSPEEVAGVLAHELAHVKHRHVLAQVIRNGLLGAVWALTLGDYSGLLVVDPGTAYNLATLRHSRHDEAEADATAARMMQEQGISTQGLVDFFERHRGGDNSWLSSHPAMDDRVSALRAAAVAAGSGAAVSSAVLDRQTFYRLRSACDSSPRIVSLRQLFFP